MKPGSMTYDEEKLLIFFGQVKSFTLVLNFLILLLHIACCKENALFELLNVPLKNF